MTGLIESVSTRVIHVPLSRPWAEDVREIGVVEVCVSRDDGIVGHGFSWTPSIGATAVDALIRDDLAPWLTGRPADASIWQQAWEHVHEAGGGGITTIALAGVDLALWDLNLRERGLALADALGRKHESLPAYGSGVNLHYTIEELVSQAARWRDAGYGGAKIKVGKPDLAEDVDRVAAVRETIGPNLRLMIDANQRWDLGRATHAVAELAPFGLEWIEEPLRSDDSRGYRQLHDLIDVPIALGENLHTIHRFRELIDAEAIDVIQPNVVRVGGITPFLRIVELARESGLLLAPHLLPELSAQLAFALPEKCWVEDVEDAGFASLGALAEPSGVDIVSGRAVGGHALGIGIRFA
ncbi:mandelate racemase/muconate lactonizing enzyme family protein [Lacisediminihabitans profunda]|uniref:Mandelate racemase/muconate lactonizing enzyme family protein n=1 Tax=Lacisediminihabitans profunda TaxID=2594790 RepID=A0A5C8URJ4_9MICO|nr:mandelate racemase/muconate lactonizing enzyme family protein [Lacisediminihabitans profunda]TXN30912.1 mandelate racemase/muconate lactonizing enzyme family protein [Lacisediminihabitans profunda]